MDMILGLLAIMGLVGVVVAKFLTTKKGHALRRMIIDAQQINGKIKGELKIAESTRAAAGHDLKAEERKLRTLRLRVEKYDKEIESLKK